MEAQGDDGEATTASGSTGKIGSLVGPFRQHTEIINRFIQLVERPAEEKMIKTGKMEGAHHAAMKKLQKATNEVVYGCPR